MCESMSYLYDNSNNDDYSIALCQSYWSGLPARNQIGSVKTKQDIWLSTRQEVLANCKMSCANISTPHITCLDTDM